MAKPRCLVPMHEAPWQRDAAAVLAPALRGGRPLSRTTLSTFGARFDHDFSGVRVHTDRRAARTARELRARAFTFGSDIVFGQDRLDEQSEDGRRLLAHELAHVVQQRPLGASGAHVARETDPAASPVVSCEDDPVVAEIVNELEQKLDAVGEGRLSKSWTEMEDLLWRVSNKTELYEGITKKGAYWDSTCNWFHKLGDIFDNRLEPNLRFQWLDILHTGAPVLEDVAQKKREYFRQAKAEILAMPEYNSLPESFKFYVPLILRNAERTPYSLYYAYMLRAALLTKDITTDEKTAEERAEKNRKRTNDAAVEAAEMSLGPGWQARKGIEEDTAEARKAAKGLRPVFNTFARRFYYIDASDPTNIVARVYVRLKAPEPTDEQKEIDADPLNPFDDLTIREQVERKSWQAKIRMLEDPVEKRLSEMAGFGYTVDIEFVTRKGNDVFEVDLTNHAEWTNSGSWMGGGIRSIAHEVGHLLGLDDRYNYVRSHAKNKGMAMKDRLHWFLVQVIKKPKEPGGTEDPYAAESNMGYGKRVTDDDACRATKGGKEWKECVEERQRARAASTPTAP